MKKIVLFTIGLFVFTNNIYAKEVSNLDTVTVTAQKTEESTQQIPMSISVLDEYFILDSSIENTNEISAYIPNLTTMISGSRDYFSRIAIRGISNTGIGDPAVALYIDGISYADIYAFNSPLFDIERIEVLKGPQGTLYGKNTEAGVINIITKGPSDTLESNVKIELGNYKKKQITGSINIPILEDKLFLKLSALKSSRDGYIKNLDDNSRIDSHDTLSFRSNLLLKANDNLDVNMILGYNKLDDDGGFPMTPIDKETYKTDTGITNLNDFESSFNHKGTSSSKNKTAVVKVNYRKNKYDLVSVTAYRNMDNESTMDGDFTPTAKYLGFNERESSSINQEFRLSAKESESFKWLLGAYIHDEDKKAATGYKYDQAYATYSNVPLYSEDRMSANLDSLDMALFGQSTLKFLDNKLGVTAGVRYEKSKRTMDNRTHTFMGTNTATPITGLERNDSVVLPKLSIDYDLNQNTMIYTTISKGYKAGGFSYAVDDLTLVEYKPEISKALEIGLKSNFPELGLMFNMSAFYTKVDDYQDRLQINPTTIVQSNATEVDIKGLEIESSYIINNNFTISGNFGLTDAKYGSYINPINQENYKDNKVSLIPEYDLNFALKYRNNSGIFANFEIQNTGEKYFDRLNSKKLDSFTVYNAKIGYEQEKWDLYLSVKNITDEEYFLDGYLAGNMGYMGTVGAPRTVSISYNIRF